MLLTVRTIGIALLATGVCLSSNVWGQVRQGPPPQRVPQQPGPPPQYGPQPAQLPPPRTASRQQVPLPNRPPQAPFELTREQEQELIRVLRLWEERSSKIKTLASEFKKWEYDQVFGKRNPLKPDDVIPTESIGEIKYAAPDRGLYHITQIREVGGMDGNQPKFQTRTEGGEHWVCDGQSIWQYNYEKKQLIETRLPPQMQGKAIADGPLPFLFNAEADKLLARYWMRIVTPPNIQNQVWLEAFPKHQADAANFRRATVILDAVTLLPHAIEVHLPSGNNRAGSRHVHQFHNNLVNDNSPLRFFKGDFSKPALPRGWTKVEDSPRGAQAATASPRG